MYQLEKVRKKYTVTRKFFIRNLDLIRNKRTRKLLSALFNSNPPIMAFKTHYGSLLVDFLIEQVSEPMESELIMPYVKQFMRK
jgi:hypothetical protein